MLIFFEISILLKRFEKLLLPETGLQFVGNLLSQKILSDFFQMLKKKCDLAC